MDLLAAKNIIAWQMFCFRKSLSEFEIGSTLEL
jgi:hypothetical protein